MQKTLKSYGSHVLWPDHCFRAYQMKTNAELLRKYLPSDLPGGIFTRSVVTFCRQLFYLHKTFHDTITNTNTKTGGISFFKHFPTMQLQQKGTKAEERHNIQLLLSCDIDIYISSLSTLIAEAEG